MINKKLPNTFKIYTLFFYFFALPLFGSEDPRSHPKYTNLKNLLPGNHNSTIVSMTDLPGGKNNDVVLCETIRQKYILRAPKKICDPDTFKRNLQVHTRTSYFEVSPFMYNAQVGPQQILMEYVPHESP